MKAMERRSPDERKYRLAFRSIPEDDLVRMMSEISAIKPIIMKNHTAQYRFDKVFRGVTNTFPIEFVKEHRKWKIMEY